MQVICNKADEKCAWCGHSVPHDPVEVSDGKADLHLCTGIGECQMPDSDEVREVQCVEVE